MEGIISRLRDYEDTLAVYGISNLMTSIPEYDQNNVHPIYLSIALSLISLNLLWMLVSSPSRTSDAYSSSRIGGGGPG